MAEKKPRVRKVETVRERNEKATLKAETSANKIKSRPVRKVAGAVAKPLRPLGVVAKPFRTRPVRFVGRWTGRILFPRYFRNSYRELRQVKWPTWKETWKLTFAVLSFAIVFAIFITGADYGLDKIIRRIVLR